MTNLYHYTTALQWAEIERAGIIDTVESNVSLRVPNAGPNVVWLLDVPDAWSRQVGWLSGGQIATRHSVSDGLEPVVRIQVDVPAVRWVDWDWTKRMSRRWRDAFIDARGGVRAATRWYVHPALIRHVSWLSVIVDERARRPA
jgi:hypothetical protein